MKKFLLFIILVFSIKSMSQNIEKTIVLLDADSKAPIQDATVLVLRSKQILLSNVEGKTVFVLNSPSNIQISHSAYADISVRSSSLKEKETIFY